MNRWYLAALVALVAGLMLAFFVVPFDDGACPTMVLECQKWGAIPRILTLVATGIASLLLATVGATSGEAVPR